MVKSGARLDLCNDKGEHILHQIIQYKRKECWKIVKHLYKNNSDALFLSQTSYRYRKHIDHKTCLILAFEHQPEIYFFQRNFTLCSIFDLMNIELISILVKSI